MSEFSYLNLLQEIMDYGQDRKDRTGVGTRSVVGAMLRFSLADDRIPAFTTKKLFWQSATKELIWMLRGQTDSKILEEQGVNIWKGNSTRKFLDDRGLTEYPEGVLGPVYGFQWRNWNGDYTINDVPGNTGIDQLGNVIEEIKKNPNSRRLVVSAWNPEQIDQMALPPCHILFQFHVVNGKLSCTMYQRSCDMFLGVPFNVFSYSLLTHMVAKITNLEPGEFVWMGGDVHIYHNHFDAVKEQLTRYPAGFPQVQFDQSKLVDPDKGFCCIEQFTPESIQILNYHHHPAIRAPMAV